MTPAYIKHRAEIIGILDEQIATYNRWRRAFAEVVDERYYPIEWLDSVVTSGAVKVFSNEGAAIIVELKSYPSGAVDVHGLIAAGDLAAIKTLVVEAEEWGCSCGAIAALIESRAGWKREMQSSGYRLHQICIRKELRV